MQLFGELVELHRGLSQITVSLAANISQTLVQLGPEVVETIVRIALTSSALIMQLREVLTVHRLVSVAVLPTQALISGIVAQFYHTRSPSDTKIEMVGRCLDRSGTSRNERKDKESPRTIRMDECH